MERRAAKELLHIRGWLDRVDEVVERGRDAYLADDLLQEAGDSLMMKLGEAANRLSNTRRARSGRRRLGACGGEPQLPHPSVRRDQPRAHLAHALARPARMEAIARESGRGGRRNDQRRVRQCLSESDVASLGIMRRRAAGRRALGLRPPSSWPGRAPRERGPLPTYHQRRRPGGRLRPRVARPPRERVTGPRG